MTCILIDHRVAADQGDIGQRNFDFIPFAHPSRDKAFDTRTKEARARDELRRVVRRRVMNTYLREKRNDTKQKPSTQSGNLNMATERHAIDTIPCGNTQDPFNTAPIKLEAYMYDLLQFCE